MRVASKVLAGILDDQAGALDAVGEVSAFLSRSPPGETHPVDLGGKFLDPESGIGCGKISHVGIQNGEQEFALGVS